LEAEDVRLSLASKARKNGSMTAESPDTSLSRHLAELVANGDVRPGDGTRFLPEPVKPAEGDKTAADYVAEGRR
jgi:hypothetical protein